MVNGNGLLISYPKDGTRRTGLSAGKYFLNFRSGKVVFPNGSSEDMTTSLDNLGIRFIKSVTIYTTNANIIIRIFPQSVPIRGDQSNFWWYLEDIEADGIEIEYPSTSTNYELQVVASSSPVASYKPVVISRYDTIDLFVSKSNLGASGTHTSTVTDIAGYITKTISINASNTGTLVIDVSPKKGGSLYAYNTDNNIPANTFTTKSFQEQFGDMRIRFASATANATVDAFLARILP